MKRLRDPQWFLIIVFLAIIAGVPLAQIVLEFRDENGVRALEIFGQAPTAENLRLFEHNLEAANWANRFTRPWLQFAQFAWLNEGGDKAAIGRQGWYFYKPGLKYMLARPDGSKPQPGTNDPVAAITDFRDQLATRGIQLLVVPVPNKDSVYPDQLTARAKGLSGVLAPRTQQVMAALRSAGIEVVDLFSEFTHARQQCAPSCQTPLYLAQDTHWSPAGMELAAKVVARRLLDLGWARPGPVEYREKSAPVQRQGDILRMLQVPMVERSVAPENVPTMQVVRADDGALYKDVPQSEILVLGDSFMRIYQQDEPTSAGFIAHLAKELKQPLLSLVNDGGGATLVRQELRASPVFLKQKKVVVWEFVERDIGLGVEGWKFVRLPGSTPGR